MSESPTPSDELPHEPMPRAIVVGGGPAGLSLSLGLSQRGYKVTIVEKYESFSVQGASFGMAKNGIKALNEIYPDIVQDRMINTKKAISLPHGSIVLPWWMMRDALLDQVREEEDKIQLLMGVQVVDIVDDEEGREQVSVTLSNGNSIQGQVVIGADGVHSSIRHLLGLQPNEITGTKIFRGTVEIPVPLPDLPHDQSSKNDDSPENISEDAVVDAATCSSSDTCTTNNTSSTLSSLQPLLEKGMVPISSNYKQCVFFVLNFHPHIPGRMCWVLSTSDPNFDTQKMDEDKTMNLFSLIEQKEQDDVEKQELIQSILQASTEDARRYYTETKVTDFSEEVLDQFHGRWGGKGRVTLIGDAAHAMRPTDGQGGNMAFEDALVLCQILANSNDNNLEPNNETASSVNIAKSLELFEQTRLPRVQKIHDNQRLRYEARMKGETPIPWTDEFKEWVTNGV